MSLTKQDVQGCLENARMRLMSQVPSRQDIQILKDTTRSLLSTMSQNQSYITQAHKQNAEILRHTLSLESRIAQLESELHEVRNTVVVISNHRHQISNAVDHSTASSGQNHQRYSYGLAPTNFTP